MSEFLEGLKKAADSGEFNSEAAKKIIEINELVDTKINGSDIHRFDEIRESLDKCHKEAGTKTVTEDEAIEMNSQYEKKMEQLKKMDGINAQLATLMEIEDMVKASVEDMFTFVESLENRFEKEIEAEDPMLGDLSQKIEQLKAKYSSIINN